ncbi:GGDEF domain-containing protein [Pelomonas sp. SE-A7]|uniref:GGDEF domain-containing protein n=1 Tax=Pelomonas sp. SE-A7 TaxID=3054953 RepID=UPI00259C813E|nr:GGDEF domain-containing protein [Pelomonas sp. SE-A7]MDM4768355.1 GGDEF domain-containing protein [Pelomonas sp. SE-A7]
MLEAEPLTLLATNMLFLLAAALVWGGLGRVFLGSQRPALMLAVANALLAASLGCNSLRGVAWDLLTYWGANLMSIGAFALLRLAVPAAVGETPRWRPVALLMAAAAVVLAPIPSQSDWMPIANFSFMSLLIGLTAIDTWRRLRQRLKAGLALGLSSPLFLVAALLLLRLVQLLGGSGERIRDASTGNVAWLWAVLVMSLVLNATLAFMVLMRLILRIRRLTERDPLTDALNRRAFGELQAREQGELGRGRGYALVTLDVDHFKRLNDTLGHAAGDAALKHLVQVLQACLRDADQLGRLGGEEFGVLLPLSDQAGAICAAERMRTALAARPLRWEDKDWPLSASFGVAVASRADEGVDAVMLRADKALYRAKQAGRNRVEFG